MTGTCDLELAAHTPVQAWREGRQIHSLPPAARPARLAQGCDVQARVVRSPGGEMAGWKLGVGSEATRLACGQGRAVVGRVAARALPDHGVADPLSLIGEACLAAARVRSHDTGRRAVGLPSSAAHIAGFHARVVGAARRLQNLSSLRRGLSVQVDGQPRVRAAAGADRCDPLRAYTDLLARARERCWVLLRGSIASTGTPSVPVDVQGAASVVARCEAVERAFSMAVGGA